jgi:hypothetical protein
VVAVAGTLLPALDAALRRGSVTWLATGLRLLPTGWGPVAVEAAGRADWPVAAGSLAGLAVLTMAAAAWWPFVLTRRMDAAARPARAGAARRGSRPALTRTPAGAVTAKEIRMWVRDPVRLTCLLIAVIVGAATCAIPRITAGTNLLLPYAGILTAVIAGACACNLYGSDGTSLWLTVMTPGATRADIRGRQAAWLIVVAPYTIAVTIAFTVLSGQYAAWPWALALLPAVLGGAAGLAPLASLVSVQPLDETGNPTPAWSLKSPHCPAGRRSHRARTGHNPAGRRALANAVAILGRRTGRNRHRRVAGRIPRQACSHTAGKPAGQHLDSPGRRGTLGHDDHRIQPGGLTLRLRRLRWMPGAAVYGPAAGETSGRRGVGDVLGLVMLLRLRWMPLPPLPGQGGDHERDDAEADEHHHVVGSHPVGLGQHLHRQVEDGRVCPEDDLQR